MKIKIKLGWLKKFARKKKKKKKVKEEDYSEPSFHFPSIMNIVTAGIVLSVGWSLLNVITEINVEEANKTIVSNQSIVGATQTVGEAFPLIFLFGAIALVFVVLGFAFNSFRDVGL